MKKIAITESQRDEILSLIQEMLDPNSDITVKSTNQTPADKANPVNALTKVTKSMKAQGINPNKPGIHVAADANINGTEMNIVGTTKNNQSTSMQESIIISKQQLEEMRLRKLKEGSRVIKLKDLKK